MDLIRNKTEDGSCKYRLWDNVKNKWIDDDKPGDEHEFFVIMLKDIHSVSALLAYARSIEPHDREFAAAVTELATRAGVSHPNCKHPDTDPYDHSKESVVIKLYADTSDLSMFDSKKKYISRTTIAPPSKEGEPYLLLDIPSHHCQYAIFHDEKRHPYTQEVLDLVGKDVELEMRYDCSEGILLVTKITEIQ